MTTQTTQITDHMAEWPVSVAVQELTGWETIAIKKHYKVDLSQLGGVELTMATVWALENRRRSEANDPPATWTEVESLSLRQLNGYFPPEPAEPDSEMGKD